MLTSKGLVVSLPGAELRTAKLPSSFFTPDDLTGQPVSAALKAAVRAVAAACASLSAPLMLVARPEIFTNGPTRAWLETKLNGIEDHLNLSDGSVVQLIPGLRNHLFFYAAGRARGLAQFKQFIAWVPELPAQITSQFNTAFTFRCGEQQWTPEPVILAADSLSLLTQNEFDPLYLNPHAIADSVNRIALANSIPASALNQYREIEYIPFCETAAGDKEFCRLAATRIIAVASNPQCALILGAPWLQTRTEDSDSMLTALLQGLQASGEKIPRVQLQNILIAQQPLEPGLIANLADKISLLMPHGFEFWRFPASYWQHFTAITVAIPRLRQHDAHPLADFYAQAFTRPPQIIWTTLQQRPTIDAEGELAHG